MDKIEKIRELIQEYDKDPHYNDDAGIFDLCGGNYDDAYYIGSDDGSRWLAREILKIINEKL